MSLPTKRDLVERVGMSVDFWDDQCAKRTIPFTKIGRKIFFTEEQIERIVAQFAVEPKRVPTTDEVSRKRAQRIGRAA